MKQVMRLRSCSFRWSELLLTFFSDSELTGFYVSRVVDKFDIPLVPLQSMADLPSTLSKFHRAFLQGDASKRLAQAPVQGVLETLLPYCVLSPPLGEHSINILSDLTVGFADIANKVNSEVGRAEILSYFGQEEAERIILFWMQEYLF